MVPECEVRIFMHYGNNTISLDINVWEYIHGSHAARPQAQGGFLGVKVEPLSRQCMPPKAKTRIRSPPRLVSSHKDDVHSVFVHASGHGGRRGGSG